MNYALKMIYKMALKHEMRVEDIAKGWFEMQGYIKPGHRRTVPEYVKIVMKYRIR